jgi:acetoacetyl-CoA synthetase
VAEKLWEPSSEQIRNAALTRFTQFIEQRTARIFSSYTSLHAWSVENPEEFWSAVWEFTGIRARSPWTTVLSDRTKMPGAEWFAGARLNFAENLLSSSRDQNALFVCAEETPAIPCTFGDLSDRVAQVAAALRIDGVVAGDRVAGVVSNGAEAVIAFLAAASIGAVWSSCSPDFGASGVLQRFSQIEPKVLFVTESYRYNGKLFDCREKNSEIQKGLPTVQKIIRINPFDTDSGTSTFQEYGRACKKTPHYEQLPFTHPLCILFSSGTTGLPKCIVHSAGGTLIQHYKEHQLHTDLSAKDVLLYFTTTGWMMWNWLVSALGSGTPIVLYDGSPTHPHHAHLFDLVDQLGITVFGTSAAFLSSLEKNGMRPKETHRLTNLRSILSTGSPLSPASAHYVYREIRKDLCLSSISGGTDIVSCFVLGNPTLPVYAGQIQCKGLGMDVAVLSDDGDQIYGAKGELVCKSPFPSMPLCFYGDKDGSRYHDAYFSRFSGIWNHGDYAFETPDGQYIIFGRSDTVLNPGGVRIGTAEIYREVLSFPEIHECIAVDQEWEGTTRILLFVQMRSDHTLSDDLKRSIKERLKTAASPRHVPAEIYQVPDIPRTRSGKIVEKAVRETIAGVEIKNLEALANPEALAYFRDLMFRKNP